MASAGSIYIDLLLNDGRYIQGLNRSKQATSQAAQAWQRDVNKTRDSFHAVINPIDNISAAIKNLGGVFAGALSVQQVVRYSDTFKGLESRLGLVTDSASELADVQARLFAISQNTAQPLSATIDAYTRIAGSLTDAQEGQTNLIRLTELLSKTLVISGTNAAGAATFYQQFGQAASSDFKAIGQELQTFADQNPRFYAILRDEAALYGKSLKKMGEDGELSFDFINKALMKSGAVIDEQAKGITVTVGKAFTQLDNALLKYIGQSDAVAGGTSTLALGISGLANNFDLVVDGVLILSSVMIARLIPAATATAVQFAFATQQSIGLQLALGRMSGLSTAATGSLIGLSAAARGASTAMSFFGGPIGLAATAAIIAFTTHTNTAVEAEDRYNKIIGEVSQSYVGYAAASGEARIKIETDSKARMDALIKEREELEKLVFGLAALDQSAGNALLVGLSEFAGKLGIGQAPSELIAQYEAAQKALEALQKARREGSSGPPASTGDADGLLKKYETYISGISKKSKEFQEAKNGLKTLFDSGEISAEKYAFALANLEKAFPKESGYKATQKSLKDINSLYDQNLSLITGLTSEQIAYNAKVEDLTLLLTSGRISQEEYNASLVRAKNEILGLNAVYEKYESYITGLSPEQLQYAKDIDEVTVAYENGRFSAEQYYSALAGIDQKFDESSKKAAVWSFDIEEAGKEASRNIQSAFADFLFDPFEEGLDGMLNSFLNTVKRMAAERASAEILAGFFGEDGIDFGDVKKIGGKASGFLSGLFDGFFADGGFIKPGHFGVAGEAGAELIFGGNTGASVIPMGAGGGGKVTVNIINNAGASVSQSQRQTSSGMELDVMIDQAVAANISRQGSKTNQALSNLSSRSLVRR